MQCEHENTKYTTREIARQTGAGRKTESDSEKRRCNKIQICLYETFILVQDRSDLAETAKHLAQRRITLVIGQCGYFFCAAIFRHAPRERQGTQAEHLALVTSTAPWAGREIVICNCESSPPHAPLANSPDFEVSSRLEEELTEPKINMARHRDHQSS